MKDAFKNFKEKFPDVAVGFTSSIVQIIFSIWSFEINEDYLRNQRLFIGLVTFSNQHLIYSAPCG